MDQGPPPRPGPTGPHPPRICHAASPCPYAVAPQPFPRHHRGARRIRPRGLEPLRAGRDRRCCLDLGTFGQVLDRGEHHRGSDAGSLRVAHDGHTERILTDDTNDDSLTHACDEGTGHDGTDDRHHSRAVGGVVVYLTFDDGPGPATPEVLELLARYHARATFALIGQQAAANPALVSRIRAGGHVIVNHTWDHPDLTLLSTEQIDGELQRTEGVLGPLRCDRPPYGATSTRVAAAIAARGERQLLWDVDPADWSRPGAEVIAATVLAQVRSGSIVLLHDGGGDRSQTVTALETILRELSARGFALTSVRGC